MVAPGIDLWTTDERGPGRGYNLSSGKAGLADKGTWYGAEKDTLGDGGGEYTATFGGTSGATPHVAGLAALLVRADPTLSNGQIRNILERTCKPIGDGYGDHPLWGAEVEWSPFTGCGLIQVERALTEAPELKLLPVLDPLTEPEPCTVTDVFIIVGEPVPLTAAPAPDRIWRVHRRDALSTWVEVREKDIIDDIPIAGGLRGSRLKVRIGAPVRYAGQEQVRAERSAVRVSP